MSEKESNGRINVLQLTYGLRFGGMEKVIQNLCRGLDKGRFNVMACCLTKKGEYAEELEREGYKVYLCSQVNRLNKYTKSWRVKNILEREKIHILHSHNTQAFLDGVVGAKLARTPVFIHTDHVRKFPDRLRYMVAEKIASYFVDEIVAVSNHVKENLIKYEKIPSHKISIIYNGTDFSPSKNPDVISAVRDEFNIKPDEKVVGCVARLRPQKAYELFLKVAARILGQISNVKFLIVGDGEEYNRLVNLCNYLGITSYVYFTGARADVERVISIFDVFLLTSLYEGMPICLLESMASGIPIVATAVGGVPELIQDGVSGFVVHSRDPDQIAERVIRLLSNDDLRIKMGRTGQRVYQTKFTAKKMVAQYTELYQRHLMAKRLR